MPSCCCYLYVVGDVPAGPSWSKHFQALSWVGGPLSPKHLVSPVPGVAAPCNYACLPVQGATWARVPSCPGTQAGEVGTSAPAAGQLGLKVSTTKAVKGNRRLRTPVPALRRRRRSSGPDRKDKLQSSCNANKQTYPARKQPSSNREPLPTTQVSQRDPRRWMIRPPMQWVSVMPPLSTSARRPHRVDLGAICLAGYREGAGLGTPT